MTDNTPNEFSRPAWATLPDTTITGGNIRQVVIGSLEDIAAANAAGLTFEPHCEPLHQLAEQLIFGDEIDLERGFRILMEMAATYPCYEAKGRAGDDIAYLACDDPRIILKVLIERYGAEVIRDHLAEQIDGSAP